ncbi:hypothetical protein DL237_05865 [Pseudooceanicola sediminis]|uniref:Uncharacterized protein n=1 Tax=Pseudooceanicola sediminis TaxID=2211117 RepID=A0A399J6Q1_9RHOB|nr:hypothetical protein [Pseudooceanicola sediminis]KAA2317318.1 hypothetical protein E0K93_03240 [Puniceibacterium sp. HSS470]RII39672.1 hypothetical protein DL237_05865 [Pseudooceanicola sediminis]
MQLIIGTQAITPADVRQIPGGIEAELAGDALTCFLDGAANGASMELHGGALDRHAVDVTEIRMHGCATKVTLMTTHEMALN